MVCKYERVSYYLSLGVDHQGPAPPHAGAHTVLTTEVVGRQPVDLPGAHDNRVPKGFEQREVAARDLELLRALQPLVDNAGAELCSEGP